MAEPDSATTAISLVQSSLKELLVKVCKAEQRSKMLTTLLRLRLLPKDMKNFVKNQLKQQRNQVPGGLGTRLLNQGKTDY